MLVSIYIVRERKREERGKWRLRKAKDGQQQQQNGPRLYLIKRWRIKNWQPRCSLRRQLGKQLVASPILWWPPVDYAQQSRKMRRPVKKSIRNQFRHMPTMKSPSQTNTTSYRALTYRNDVFFSTKLEWLDFARYTWHMYTILQWNPDMRWQEIKDSAEGNNKKIGGECLIINNEIMIMLSTSIPFCPFFSLSQNVVFKE